MELLHSEDPADRGRAATYLGEGNEPDAYELLIQLLDDDSVKASAACALGMLGDKRAVDRLIKEMLDDNSPAQVMAAEALWQIGDPRTLEPFLSIADHKHPYLRLYTARALGKMPDQRAVDALLKLVEDSNFGVRASATGALARVAEALGVNARPVLLRIFAQDPDDTVRAIAASQLKRLGDDRAWNQLMQEEQWRYLFE